MIGARWLRLQWQQSRIAIVVTALLSLSVFCLVLSQMERFQGEAALLRTVGGSALGSGIFALLLKLLQVGGVIRDELVSVVFGDDFLTVRRDVLQVWLKTTRALYAPKFPELAPRLDLDVWKSVLPLDKLFYLKGVERHYRITPLERPVRRIRVEVSMTYQLVTACDESGSVARVSEFQFRPAAIGDGNVAAVIEAQKSKYSYQGAGAEHPGVVDEVLEDVELSPDLRRVRYRAMLKAGSTYEVKDHATFEQDLTEDNVLSFVAVSYVDGCSVSFTYPRESLVLQFSPLGAVAFADGPDLGRFTLHKICDGLLFSESGFLVTLQGR